MHLNALTMPNFLYIWQCQVGIANCSLALSVRWQFFNKIKKLRLWHDKESLLKIKDINIQKLDGREIVGKMGKRQWKCLESGNLC